MSHTPDPEPTKRGGIRTGAGRKAIGATKGILVRLTEAQRAIAEQLGGGNVNAGIRLALDQATGRKLGSAAQLDDGTDTYA